MSVYVRAFKVSDLLAFVPIEPLAAKEIKDPELAKAIEDSGLAVTGIRDGEIIGCGGVHPVEDSEDGVIWLRLSRKCMNNPIDTFRWIKSGLKIIEETYPFRQLNATILSKFKRGIKLAEKLGFKQVQTMTEDGRDYIVYAKRVKE